MYEDDEKIAKRRAWVRLAQFFGFIILFYVLICIASNYLALGMKYMGEHQKPDFNSQTFWAVKLKYFYIPDKNFPLPVIALGSAIISLLLVMRLDTNWHIKNDNKNIKGRERFMNEKELDDLLYSFPINNMESAEKSGIILALQDGRYYVDAETIHSLIIGTTRSGKGQTFVLPMVRHIALSKAKHSMVLNDPKGEILENSYDMLVNNGYEVRVINLRDTDKSSLWNPLQDIIDLYKQACDTATRLNRKPELSECIKQVQSLASVFTANDQSDPIWPGSAKSLLVAMILFLLDQGYKNGHLENVSMYSVYMMFIAFGTENEVQSVNGAKKEINALDSLFQALPIGSPAKSAYATSRFSSGDTRSSIFTTLSQNIDIFGSDTGISKLTSGNQIKFQELANPDKPMAIFMVVPDEDPSRHVIASLFINQCYNALVQYSSTFTGQKLPQRVQFILDEFGNMVQIPVMDTKITVGAGRNLLFNLFVQDLNQLDTKYDNAAKTIRSNCGNMIYINSLDDDTNKYFSSILGDKTVEYNTYSGDLHSFLSHQSGTVDSEPLIKPAELGRMPFGSAITKRQRCYPIKTRLKPFYEFKLEATSIDIISQSMDLIHQELDDTIYPLNEIWELLFEPVVSPEGFIYKRDLSEDTHYYKVAADKKAEWIKFSINEESEKRSNTIHKDFMRNPEKYISIDENTRTKWDNKRLSLAAEKQSNNNTVTKTDFTDKTEQPPSELDIAIKQLESVSDDKSAFMRYIDEKNYKNAKAVINQAFVRKQIDKRQNELLIEFLNKFFNHTNGE